MFYGDGIPNFQERRMRSRMNMDGLVLRRFGQAMTGHLLFNFGHNQLRFHGMPVNHKPAWALRHRVTEKDDAQSEYRANAKGEPPSQADGHNAHIEQHNCAAGANGRPDPETGIDDQVHAST